MKFAITAIVLLASLFCNLANASTLADYIEKHAEKQNDQAQESSALPEIYKIRNLKVTVDNSDLQTAKNNAIWQAKKMGFVELINRFVAYGYLDKPVTLTDEQLRSITKEPSVIEELVTGTKYEARYNLDFLAEPTLKLFNLPSSKLAPAKESYLLLPVFIENEKIKIWESDWFSAWKTLKTEQISTPIGDIEDAKSISAENVANLDFSGLDTLARRYKKPIIALIEANYNVRENKLAVTIKRFENKARILNTQEFQGSFGMGSADLFAIAARSIFEQIKANGIPRIGEELQETENAKDKEIEYNRDYMGDKRSQQKDLSAYVIVRSLSDWSALRRKLINFPIINDIVVKNFADNQTDINLYYMGEIDELEKLFAQNGLTITADHNRKGSYIIDRID